MIEVTYNLGLLVAVIPGSAVRKSGFRMRAAKILLINIHLASL